MYHMQHPFTLSAGRFDTYMYNTLLTYHKSLNRSTIKSDPRLVIKARLLFEAWLVHVLVHPHCSKLMAGKPPNMYFAQQTVHKCLESTLTSWANLWNLACIWGPASISTIKSDPRPVFKDLWYISFFSLTSSALSSILLTISTYTTITFCHLLTYRQVCFHCTVYRLVRIHHQFVTAD